MKQLEISLPDPKQMSHGEILVHNFIRQNPTWAISSLIDYCLRYYADFGVTKRIIAKQMHDYIMSHDLI